MSRHSLGYLGRLDSAHGNGLGDKTSVHDVPEVYCSAEGRPQSTPLSLRKAKPWRHGLERVSASECTIEEADSEYPRFKSTTGDQTRPPRPGAGAAESSDDASFSVSVSSSSDSDDDVPLAKACGRISRRLLEDAQQLPQTLFEGGGLHQPKLEMQVEVTQI